jgi:hypothetical protein
VQGFGYFYDLENRLQEAPEPTRYDLNENAAKDIVRTRATVFCSKGSISDRCHHC